MPYVASIPHILLNGNELRLFTILDDGNYLADVTEEMIKNFPEKIKILLEKLYRKHRDEFLELNSVKKSFRRRYKKSLNSIPVQVRPPKQNPKTIPALKKLDTRTSLGFSGTVSLVLQEKRKMEDVSI